MAAPTNHAAYVEAPAQKPFVVREAPFPSKLKGHEIAIRVRALAINPVDAFIQEKGVMLPSSDYPFILGNDIAGEVYAIGSQTRSFKPGDRVVAMALGIDHHGDHDISKSGFQEYVRAWDRAVAKIPDEVSFAEAAVLPLGIATSASALFARDTLDLAPPQIPVNPAGKGQVVIVWGAASSVGSNAVQMLKAAGYKVAATAGPDNQQYCKDLGADHVFDYKKEDVLEEMAEALKGQESAGLFAAVFAGVMPCARLAQKLGANKFVSSVFGPEMPDPEGFPSDVGFSKVWSTDLVWNDVGDNVWCKWLPAALANGSMKCKPDPVVVGKGLGSVQSACDRMLKGMSAGKLVVELP